jgi:CRISPR-associated protein Csx17
MNTIRLTGCRPEPLLSYLKALGIFRLVAEQADKTARAAWHDDVFVLHTALSESELLTFFAERYTPTPIVAPWAGGSGFFKGDDTESVNAIVRSANPRLALYRQVIEQARAILKDLKQVEKPKDEAKDSLFRIYRREMPDEFVKWMDSAVVLQNESQIYPPLLGTGGNDGRLNFSLNLMQHLVNLGFADDKLASESDGWLKNALYGFVVSGLSNGKIGQFDPGRAGGYNATQGMEGNPLLNPWEFVFMLEGAILMAGSVARRLSANAKDKAAFPFTVLSSSIGQGTLDAEDLKKDSKGRDKARGEIWLPLWSNPARFSELRQIFAEGRAQVGKRQANNGVDFARAIAGLGVDRGLTGFTRYTFLKRRGDAFVAIPLGRFETRTSAAHVSLLDETEDWLDKFRRACGGDNVPGRFGVTLRRLEESIFEYCRFGGPARFGEIVRSLGICEREVSFNSDKPGAIGKSLFTLRPVPLLSPDWLLAAQEDSSEFRIALALAAMRETGAVGALRCNLEVVTRTKWGWDWAEPQDRYPTVWSATSLPRNLQAVLERRMIDATRAGLEGLPLESHFSASAEDVSAFLNGQTDDGRIEEWLWGLMLIDLAQASHKDLAPMTAPEIPQPLPRAYALLKLLFLPKYHALQSEGGHPIKPEPAILSHLSAQRLPEACQLAARRLRASGYINFPGPVSGGRTRLPDYSLPKPMLDRLAAALLIPVSKPEQLQALVLRPSSNPQGDF